jgi:hyperosmotically inducible protein
MTKTNKDKLLRTNVLVMICLSAIYGLTGCQQEGTAENAGKKIDRAAENVSKNIDEASEKIGKEIDIAKDSVIDKTKATGEYIDDSVITAKIKAAIENDPMFQASHVEVTTVNGVVKLSGTVDSEQILGRAMEVASSERNVKSVQTTLMVNVDKIGQ